MAAYQGYNGYNVSGRLATVTVVGASWFMLSFDLPGRSLYHRLYTSGWLFFELSRFVYGN
jgi:hypothetical protein